MPVNYALDKKNWSFGVIWGTFLKLPATSGLSDWEYLVCGDQLAAPVCHCRWHYVIGAMTAKGLIWCHLISFGESASVTKCRIGKYLSAKNKFQSDSREDCKTNMKINGQVKTRLQWLIRLLMLQPAGSRFYDKKQNLSNSTEKILRSNPRLCINQH